MTHVMMMLLIVIMIPIFIMMIYIPYWTRKTESFGVSIPEKVFNTPELKSMRKKYASRMIALSIIAIFILLFIYFFMTNDEFAITIIYSVLVIGYLLSGFFVYLIFHRQMKQRKQEEHWTQDKDQHVIVHTKFHDQKLTISNWFYLLPMTMTWLTIVFTYVFYDRFPERIPMNYSLLGEVTNWAEKSYRTVLTFPVMQLFLIGIFIFINVIISRSKQQVSAENPQESMKRNIIFRRRWSIFLFISGLALTMMFSMIQLSLIYDINNVVQMIMFTFIIGGIIIGSIILSITTGQGGSRIKIQNSNISQVIDLDDDQHWKLGQFYFNKEDPALFLEKRFGIGWSANWARPMAWILLIGIIGLAIAIPVLLSI